MKYLILILALIANSHIFSQECYELFYSEGKRAYSEFNFEKALNQFKAAKICDDIPVNSDIDSWIEKTKNGYILELKKAREIAEVNLKKANKLVSAFYFYNNRYALVNKQSNCYFIDKNGNKVEKLGHWQYAEQFNEFGFAKVAAVNADTIVEFDPYTFKEKIRILNKTERFYFIDSLGNRYPLLSDINDRADHISAIDFRNKSLAKIDSSIVQIPNLKIVIIDNNKIKNIGLFFNSDQIIKLFANNNSISSLPYYISNKCPLKVLEISNNIIELIPDQFENLIYLEELNLANNKIKNVPKSISNLKNLKVLNLSNNNIEELTNSIGELTNLRQLNLSANNIHNLNVNIGKLKKLTYLNISENNITNLPLELSKLKNLKTLIIGKDIPNDQIILLKKSLPNCSIVVSYFELNEVDD